MASYALCASPNVDDSVPILPRPVTRPMRLKVLYTFDNAQKTTCLARSSSIFQVQVIHCPPASPTSSPTRTPPRNHSSSSSSRRRPDVVGAIDLRSCIAAVASSSPELVADPSIDYAVYTVDFSERDQPLVGHGLLSWALASSAAPQHQDSSSTENPSSTPNPAGSSNSNPSAPSDLSAIPTRDNSHSSGAAATAHEVAAGTLQMVCGRVCSNVMNMFGNHGVRETLEIKLRLQPVHGATQMRFLRSMQLYVRLSKLMPGSFDAARWTSFIQSQPRVMELLTAPAYGGLVSNADNSSSSINLLLFDNENSSSGAGRPNDDYDAFFGMPVEAERAIAAATNTSTPATSVAKKGRPKGSSTQKRRVLEDMSSSSLNALSSNNNSNNASSTANIDGPPTKRPRVKKLAPAAVVSTAKRSASSLAFGENQANNSTSTPTSQTEASGINSSQQNQNHSNINDAANRSGGNPAAASHRQSLSGEQKESNPTDGNQKRPSAHRFATSVALPQRQKLTRTVTAPTPSVSFSPPSSISPSSPYYESSPQLASSPPIFGGMGDRFSSPFDSTGRDIPKSWTSDAGNQMLSSALDTVVAGHGSANATSPLSSVFDDIMSSTLDLGDDANALNSNQTLDLANDFVREFYRFDSESDLRLSVDSDRREKHREAMEDLLMLGRDDASAGGENHLEIPGGGSSSSLTNSDDLFEDANSEQKSSPITSPNDSFSAFFDVGGDESQSQGKQNQQAIIDSIRESGLILPPVSKTSVQSMPPSEIDFPSDGPGASSYNTVTPSATGNDSRSQSLAPTATSTATLPTTATAAVNGKSKEKRASRNKTKERIHSTLMQSIATGKPPLYCQNCGDIMPHAWRRIKTVTANNTVESMRVCNPCGLYYQSKKVMRPDHLWRRNRESSIISSDAIDLDEVPDKAHNSESAGAVVVDESSAVATTKTSAASSPAPAKGVLSTSTATSSRSGTPRPLSPSEGTKMNVEDKLSEGKSPEVPVVVDDNA